jgi:hypothetical protein
VRTGTVDDEVVQLAKASGAQSIVLGAPIAIGDTSVDELVAALRRHTGIAVTVADPDAPPLT